MGPMSQHSTVVPKTVAETTGKADLLRKNTRRWGRRVLGGQVALTGYVCPKNPCLLTSGQGGDRASRDPRTAGSEDASSGQK